MGIHPQRTKRDIVVIIRGYCPIKTTISRLITVSFYSVFMKKLPETVAKESPPIMCAAVLCNLSGFRPIISCFRYGSHVWMDYFNYCLTSDLYNRSQYCCIPVSGDYYLSYHRAYLKFNDASAHCIVGFC